jgi:thymidylate kinase
MFVDHGTSAPVAETIDDSENHLHPSAIAVKLFHALDQEGIRHCHWKSNIRLPQTLSGLTDIDILVHPQDAHAYQRIIHACGFKLTVSRRGVGHPGVFHALAWDRESGRWLDLHTYHQVVSGDSLVKSFRFPVEEEILANTASLHDVRVPAPSAELVLFLLRILLKHTSLIEIRKVNSYYGPVRKELSWLLERSDVDEAAALYGEWFPASRIPFQQIIDCVAKGSLTSRVAMGMRLGWALRNQRRIGQVAAISSRMMRFGLKYAGRLRKRRNLSLLAGGSLIALVGPKGAGKSTLTKLFAKSLGTKLDVIQIHFGKPPQSWLTYLPRLIVSAARKARPHEGLGDQFDEPEGLDERRYSTLFLLGRLLTAVDRQRLLTRRMRAMSSGTIVISDGCHVTNATGMDGSAFSDLAVSRARSPLQRWLMERERAIYRTLPRPRLVLQLSVPLETALERDLARGKPEGTNPSTLQSRWSREAGSEFGSSTVHPIDTGGDLQHTVRMITARAWDSM